MLTFLSILASDILPIFMIAGIGLLLERRMSGSVRPLAAVSFYALSPCLVFYQLVTSTISGEDAGRIALYAVLVIGVMGCVARLASIPLRLERKTQSSFLLVVMFSNSGNYALPLILFAFGREALSFASIYFVTSAVVVYTVGVFIAARGGQSLGPALLGLMRVPSIYALAAAGLVVITAVSLPDTIMRPVGMLNDAALPVMLLVLGMQLKRATLPERPRIVIVAALLSLTLAPLVGVSLSMLLHLSGAARQAAIILSAMPTAVVTTVLALEYELESNLVTSVVFVTTLLSPLTLGTLITLLKR